MFVKYINLHINAIEIVFLISEGNQTLNNIRLIIKINLVNNKFPRNRNKIKFKLVLMPPYFCSLNGNGHCILLFSCRVQHQCVV